jgi:hypothetical protein
MSYAEASLLIAFTTIVSVMAAGLVQRALGVDARRKLHEVGNPVYLQIGVVFAILLAFVFNEVWGEYNTAQQAINGECGSLHGAAMLAHDLPDGHGRGVEQAILNYSTIVINVEWATLEHREESPKAVSAFQAIVEAAGHLNIGQPTDATIQGQILSLLAQAHAFRETRIFQSNQGLPIIIWLILSFYGFALTLFVLFAGVESPIGHFFFTAVFVISVVSVLIVVRLLDYPFEGALRLSNDDFVKTIERVNALRGPL